MKKTEDFLVDSGWGPLTPRLALTGFPELLTLQQLNAFLELFKAI